MRLHHPCRLALNIKHWLMVGVEFMQEVDKLNDGVIFVLYLHSVIGATLI
jgi:hypothetical protein